MLRTQSSIKHFDNYYLMLVSPNSVSKTPYEGGNLKGALNYLKELIEDSSHPKLTTNEELTHQAKQLIDQLTEAAQILQEVEQNEIAPLTEWILNKVEDQGVCYLQMQWHGTPGHAFALKFRKSSDTVLLSIINLGAGNQYHQSLASNDEPNSVDYQSSELKMDFANSFDLEIFESLVHIHNDVNPLDKDLFLKSYDEEDVYGLLSFLTEQVEGSPTIVRRSTPQSTGTCTMTSLEKVLFDYFVTVLQISPNNIEKYFFVLKLRALNSALESHKKNRAPSGLIQWSLRELYFNYQQLNEKEGFEAEEARFYLNFISNADETTKEKIELSADERHSNRLTIPPPFIKLNHFSARHIGITDERNEKHKEVIHKARALLSLTREDQLIETLKTLLNELHNSTDLKSSLKEVRNLCVVMASEFNKRKELESLSQVTLKKGIRLLAKLMKAYRDGAKTLNQPNAIVDYYFSLALYSLAGKFFEKIKDYNPSNQYALGMEQSIQMTQIKNADDYYGIKQLLVDYQEKINDKVLVFNNEIGQTPRYFHNTLPIEKKIELNRLVLVANCKTENSEFKQYEILVTGSCETQKGKFVWLDTSLILDKTISSLMYLSQSLHKSLTTTFLDTNPDIKPLYGDFFPLLEINTFYQSQKTYHEKNILKKYLRDELKHSHSDVSENIVFMAQNIRNELSSIHFQERIPYHSANVGWLTKRIDLHEIKIELEEWVSEDLKVINTNFNLQFINSLIWAKEHSEQLENKAVQISLERLIFEFGVIDHSLALNPGYTLKALESFLKSLSHTYVPEKIKSNEANLCFIWIIELQHYLRHYLSKSASTYQLEISKISWPNFYELLKPIDLTELDTSIQLEYARAVLFLAENHPAEQIDKLKLIEALLISLTHKTQPTRLDVFEITPKVILNLLSSLKEDRLNKLMNSALSKTLGLKVNERWHIKNSKIISESKQHKLNLERHTLSINKEVLILHTLSNDDKNTLLDTGINVEKLTFVIKKVSPFTLISIDNKIQIKYSSQNTIETVYQTFVIDGETIRLTTYSNRSDVSFTSELINHHNFVGWRGWSSHASFIQSKDENKAYFIPKSGIYIEHKKESENWQPSGLIKIEKGNSYLHFSERTLEEFNYVHLIHENKPNEYSLIGVQLYELNLTFKYHNNELYSQEYEGYRLVINNNERILKGRAPLLVLQNQKNELLVVIPFTTLNEGTLPVYTNKVNVASNIILDKSPSTPRTFKYSFNEKDLMLGESISANLYLSLIYRALGDYKNAIRALNLTKNQRKNSKVETLLFSQLFTANDNTDLGAAFDTKFILRYFAQSQKWSKESDTWVGENTQIAKMSKKLSFYFKIRRQSALSQSQFPSYLELTTSEVTLIPRLVEKLFSRNELNPTFTQSILSPEKINTVATNTNEFRFLNNKATTEILCRLDVGITSEHHVKRPKIIGRFTDLTQKNKFYNQVELIKIKELPAA